jgi:hypothetical protein
MAGEPVAGPANTVFAFCTTNEPVKVPLVVTGEPLTLKILGNASATLVTVPVTVDAIVIEPAPLVMEIPVPAVSVEATTELPVEPM